MENLQNYLYMDSVPPSWTARAYPSSLGLTNWFADMLNRAAELVNWTGDFNVNICIFFSHIYIFFFLINAVYNFSILYSFHPPYG